MSAIRGQFQKAQGRCVRVVGLVVIAWLAAACSTTAPSRPGSQTPAASAVEATGEFIVPASMNDTWNTVGQILVRTDRVIYESRAQMLGIYGLRYRGERFLIRTQAMVIREPGDGLRTRVVALELDGSPKRSAAAIELLGILESSVPREIEKYTLPIEWKGKPKTRNKKGG